MKPFRLIAPCKDYLWGGSRLQEYGKISDSGRIAESWELSCHPDGESIIADGEYEGRTLTEFLRDHPEAFGTNRERFDRFPVLIKLIDAKENLSVQVHPDDAYALSHEGELGKTEIWYIVEAQPDAELIYGFREELTKEEFRRAIEENTLLDKVKRVSVKAGDVFFIPAGTLHAIGKGILLAEIQQNSNITYRVFDYGRVGADGKPRELHIEKALDVTTLTPTVNSAPPDTGIAGHRIIGNVGSAFMVLTVLQESDDHILPSRFRHFLVLGGEAYLRCGETEFPLVKGTSVFVPSDVQPFEIKGKCSVIQTLIL
ncbi:MAG: class I mannose-6-phosphate isomerase [Ruminococcus sp.]|nr:class I mannose-6-phosphate isomerase [Ruminococcus sp.]